MNLNNTPPLCGHLEQLGAAYFITGSQAAIAFGEPRFTNGIDVVMPKSPFNELRLQRATAVGISPDCRARFSTPEDIIVKKLEWQKMGGGDRHLRDVEGIIRVQGERLDVGYIAEQTRVLDVFAIWQKVSNSNQRKSGRLP